jgi:hypothetical protein
MDVDSRQGEGTPPAGAKPRSCPFGPSLTRKEIDDRFRLVGKHFEELPDDVPPARCGEPQAEKEYFERLFGQINIGTLLNRAYFANRKIACRFTGRTRQATGALITIGYANGKHVMAKIATTATGQVAKDLWSLQYFKSEFYTLVYLRTKGVPFVPSVHSAFFHEGLGNTCDGFSYYFIDKPYGIPAPYVFPADICTPTIHGNRLDNFITSLQTLHLDLMNRCRLREIGSITVKDGNPHKFAMTSPLGEWSYRHESNVFPVPTSFETATEYYSYLLRTGLYKGPFEARANMRSMPKRSDIYRIMVESLQQPKFPLKTLTHTSLDWANILVGEDGKIRWILDWSFVVSLPHISASHYPSFLVDNDQHENRFWIEHPPRGTIRKYLRERYEAEFWKLDLWPDTFHDVEKMYFLEKCLTGAMSTKYSIDDLLSTGFIDYKGGADGTRLRIALGENCDVIREYIPAWLFPKKWF